MTATGYVFDAGPLIGIEKRSSVMLAIVDGLKQSEVSVHVPATVLAQVWRGGHRQASLAKFLKADHVHVEALSRTIALASGVLCQQAGCKDIVDASVIVMARKLGVPVLTGDEKGLTKLRALDSRITIRTI
ncbi:MAG: PIN domain-containing protein [Actinomycetes bacterium]